MKVGLISDGKYGERAYENIREVLDVQWIMVPDIPLTTMLDDDIELDIPDKDLYVSYARHPDIILEIVELGKPTILGVLPGQGLLLQARRINPRVVGPRTMCSLEPNTGIPEIDEFARHFGRPRFHVELEDGTTTVKAVTCLRKSPCGSSAAGARFFQGKPVTKKNLQDFALSICQECRAPRFGHSCDKEVSGIIHVLEIVRALPPAVREKLDQDTKDFIQGMEQEYQKRTGVTG